MVVPTSAPSSALAASANLRSPRPRATQRAPRPTLVEDSADHLLLHADVLVIGGGPAATWSAIAATEQGASVVLVDKGYCGTSGVAATAGVGHWLVPPDADRRDEEITPREEQGGYLTDRDWTNDVLDEAWHRTALIDGWGYERTRRSRPAAGGARGTAPAPNPFARRPGERSFSGSSPDYLRFLRGKVKKNGVTVLDHSPALELLVDGAGVVSGAQGYQRQTGRAWRVASGAVVLATGGTTWKSHSLGGDVNTGEGHLMAAEVGAHLSSMEFSNFYGMVPFGTSMDKNGFFVTASYWDHEGVPITYENLHKSRAELLGASLRGTITAQFTQFPPEVRPTLRAAMPNFFMVTDKLGVDPFTERFPMDWVQEGTVRGTGGVHVLDRDAWTGVPGLFAAGDVAARDRVVGAATGAGGPNLAWAVASGTWSGRAAAALAADRGPSSRGPRLEPTGTVGLRPDDGARLPLSAPAGEGAWREITAAVRDEMLPIDKSVFRHHQGLVRSLDTLDDLWDRAGTELVPPDVRGATAIRTRETAGMLAMARWANRTALHRTETRGMHTRTDFPDTDPQQARRLLTGGLRDLWVLPDPEPPVTGTAGAPYPVTLSAKTRSGRPVGAVATALTTTTAPTRTEEAS
ncbi:FAD-dependent oxidoreductase [Oerskovia merdavium]|uniref:FAD-binding protein n=1 Tax=Oerskovia merdavium TaxID=2762227 RepID=A0ABR8U3N3_9CELL|nr:FAD-binding protein [Oerskovia merdavium]MBD7982641.1 FAD-binding protein [Oerskovia merdavium]